MPTSEDIKCHTVMARIGGWTTHKACGAVVPGGGVYWTGGYAIYWDTSSPWSGV